MRRTKILSHLCLVALSLFLLTWKPVAARDILLIDDYAGGFGTTASLLSSAGHTVTELTDEVSGGYSRVSDPGFLSNYEMEVYASRHTEAPPMVANNALETYISNGGDLLVTGFQSPVLISERSAPDLIRAMGPEYIYISNEPSLTVSGVDNYITNGPFGDFRGTSIANSDVQNALFANTGLGTIPLVQAADGQPDKIIFTDLPGAAGSVGAWQGGSRATGAAAQPEFFDGGTYQGMLLNWAEGGMTSQTEVTPRVFSTAAHPLSSSAAIDLYLGDPNDGGAFVATVGPVNVEGTMDIVGALDGSGDGSGLGREAVDLPAAALDDEAVVVVGIVVDQLALDRVDRDALVGRLGAGDRHEQQRADREGRECAQRDGEAGHGRLLAVSRSWEPRDEQVVR